MTTDSAAARNAAPASDLLAKHAATQPDKVALIDDKVARPVRTMTYAELNRYANRLANALVNEGVKPGEHVAWMGRNSIEVVAFIAAAGKAAAVPMPLNHRLTRGETMTLLNRYECVFAFVSADLAHIVEDVENETAVRGMVVFGGDAPARRSEDEWLADVSDGQPSAAHDHTFTAMVGFTSGTTGKPKRIIRDPTRGSMKKEREHIDRIWTYEPQVFITSGAISSGSSGGYYAVALSHGDTIVLQDKFDPEDWMRLVDKYKVSVAYMSPAVCRQICALPPEVKARHDLSSIRAVYAGAAKWTYAVKVMYRDTFPENTLWEIYGSTELASNAVMRPEDHWDRPGSCGKPVVGVDIVLRGDDGNVVNKPYEKGVLYVKSDFAEGFMGYENEPEATAAALWGEYRTVGDIAYFDEDGFYYICDRNKDMIVSGGVNIFPQEVEAVIDSHPKVLECTVFGIPDETWGEAVHAVVVARPGQAIEPEEITAFCRQHLSGEKVPRSVDFIDELPHTLSGKILKRELRERYWAGVGSMV